VSLGRRKVKLRGRSVPLGLASFRSPLTALIVALSLVAQLIAAPYHQALSAPADLRADKTAIAADLKAMFGDAADLCARGEDHGVPAPFAPAGHCDDQCPLCRFAAQAAAFVPPDVAQLPERLGADRHAIRAPPDFGAFSVRRAQPNRARAPPLAV
jgi:hypothetical protein